ncbi:glycosyltransferase family 4 protein [Candidatus Woesearchaeota archaeon]|nr:glycosyltransferase family 4 protein [Candidatus Woesearchaeota archaeon]
MEKFNVKKRGIRKLVEVSRINIGFVLPDLRLFGGNKRPVNISRILAKRGYNTKIYARFKDIPNWVGRDNSFEIGFYDDLIKEKNDFLFFLNPKYTNIDYLKLSNSKYKIIYILNNGGKYKTCYQDWIDSFRNDNSVIIAGNNGTWKKNYNIHKKKGYDFTGGINLEKYCPVKTTNKEHFNIVIQGRISKKWKGVAEIIKTLESLDNKDKINLIIFYTEPLNLKTSLKVEEKINIPQNKMKEIYSQGDLFVHFEDNTAGWSNTCAEAMACGIPVVCTKYGTSDFAVHNKTAYVIKRDVDELKKAVEIMMKDKELRERLAKNGHEKIKEFTWEKTVDKMEEMFNELLR